MLYCCFVVVCVVMSVVLLLCVWCGVVSCVVVFCLVVSCIVVLYKSVCRSYPVSSYRTELTNACTASKTNVFFYSPGGAFARRRC